MSTLESRTHRQNKKPTRHRPFRFRASCIAITLAGFALQLAAQKASSASSPEDLIATGHFDQALEQLDKVKGQTTASSPYLRGMAFYLKGEMTKAAAAFATAAEVDPQNLDAVEMEGVSLFRAGKPHEAAHLLEKTRQPVRRANVDPKYVLGLCYLDLARYDDARTAFANQYGFESNSAEAYLLEARMLLRRDYLPMAEKATQKALELKPSLLKAHLVLGEIALVQSQTDRALTEFRKERDLDPLDAATYERMGDAYIRNEDFIRAQEVLDRAILLEPRVSTPYILLGKVLLKQQNPFVAKMYLEHASEMDPNNYMAHFLLGQAYRSLGQDEDANREFQMVTRIQAAAAPKLEESGQ